MSFINLRFLIGILLCWLLCPLVYAQRILHTRYQVNNGLASNNIYYIIQDHQGYIWLATDNGVSKFDGSQFTTFNSGNGLPDNDIIDIREDNIGRIWVACFNGEIAFIEHNTVHSAHNDSSLSKFTGDGYIRFTTFKDKLIITRSLSGRYFEITNEGKIIEIHFRGGDYISVGNYLISANIQPYNTIRLYNSSYQCTDSLLFSSSSELYYNLESVIPFNTNSFLILTKNGSLYKVAINHSRMVLQNKVEINLKIKKLYSIQKSLWAEVSGRGIIQLDSALHSVGDYVFVDELSNQFFLDNDKNFWSCTSGSGLCLLTDNSFGYYNERKHVYNNNVVKLCSFQEKLFAGFIDNTIQDLSSKAIYRSRIKGIPKTGDRITGLFVNEKYIALGRYSTFIVFNKRKGNVINTTITNVKSIIPVTGDTLLVGTSSRCYLLKLPNIVIDTVFRGRVSALHYKRESNEVFIGTPRGLFRCRKTKANNWIAETWGEQTALEKTTISCLESWGKLILIGTIDKGLLLHDGDKVTALRIDPNSKGLNCSRIVIDNKRNIWVATYSGIYKLTTEKIHDTFSIEQTTKFNGLLSNFITDIQIIRDTIFAASPEGITCFNINNKFGKRKAANLYFENITVNGNAYQLNNALELPYDSSNITIQYAAIDYKSVGQILYKYRLIGLQNNWQYTSANTVQYESLPQGEYQFEVVAMNAAGVWSSPIVFPFMIATPWWDTIWLKLTVIMITATIVTFIVRKRQMIKHQKILEGLLLKRQILEAELKAVKAQINPHFLFNALNAVQYFINSRQNDIADKYLTLLAKLLRDTLDLSSQTHIPLEREIAFLDNYLKLEQLRLDIGFEYKIDNQIPQNNQKVPIPPFVLQPHIENAIKHGLKPKKTGTKRIVVRFSLTDNGVLCEIEDNGIGRAASARLKKTNNLGTTSFGTELAKSKLDIYSGLTGKTALTDIVDLFWNDGLTPKGTLVSILISK